MRQGIAPAPAALLLSAWLSASGRAARAAAKPYVFVPPGGSADAASAPLAAPRWTELVKRVFKKHAGVPLAPKELRSSCITWLRSEHNDDAVSKSAAWAMRHSEHMARSAAYDKEKGTRLSKAAVDAIGAHAARF